MASPGDRTLGQAQPEGTGANHVQALTVVAPVVPGWTTANDPTPEPFAKTAELHWAELAIVPHNKLQGPQLSMLQQRPAVGVGVGVTVGVAVDVAVGSGVLVDVGGTVGTLVTVLAAVETGVATMLCGVAVAGAFVAADVAIAVAVGAAVATLVPLTAARGTKVPVCGGTPDSNSAVH